MLITNALKESPFALKRFVQYLIDKKYDAKAILSNDNFLSILGYLLVYLESEKVFIIVDHRAYCTYKQFEVNNQLIIECEAMIHNTIEQKYVIAVIKAFKFIETPF